MVRLLRDLIGKTHSTMQCFVQFVYNIVQKQGTHVTLSLTELFNLYFAFERSCAQTLHSSVRFPIRSISKIFEVIILDRPIQWKQRFFARHPVL